MFNFNLSINIKTLVGENFSAKAKGDYELIQRAIHKKDDSAYTELMGRYKDSIYFMLLKMVRNKDDAEDLTLEAFGKAFMNLEQYSPKFAFSTWLFRIATNHCIDFMRKKKLQTTSIDETLKTSGGDEIGSVNKYLWQASIEVLNFLPINSADPFSGIIVFGKGKAPGSSQSYDATVYISDPALDARSLSVTVRSSDGTISSAAKREIESAILSRARQLRLKELDL